MRLIDADEFKIDYGFTWDDITPTHEEMYALIDRQPTVDAVPVKHGKWVADIDGMLRCSNCTIVPANCIIVPAKIVYRVDISKQMKFCPNCGARME